MPDSLELINFLNTIISCPLAAKGLTNKYFTALFLQEFLNLLANAHEVGSARVLRSFAPSALAIQCPARIVKQESVVHIVDRENAIGRDLVVFLLALLVLVAMMWTRRMMVLVKMVQVRWQRRRRAMEVSFEWKTPECGAVC